MNLSAKMEDRKPRWVFHPSAMLTGTPEQQVMMIKTLYLSSRNLVSQQSDDSVPADSSSNKLFVAIEQEEDDPKEKPRKERKAKGKERGGIVLSGAEKELLEWALGGFLPTGPDGLKPKEGEYSHKLSK